MDFLDDDCGGVCVRGDDVRVLRVLPLLLELTGVGREVVGISLFNFTIDLSFAFLVQPLSRANVLKYLPASAVAFVKSFDLD